MKKFLIAAFWILAGILHAQTGQPVYLTKPVTLASGSITLSGPSTVTIAGQPITILNSAATILASSGVTATIPGPVEVGETMGFTNRPGFNTWLPIQEQGIYDTNVANGGGLLSQGIFSVDDQEANGWEEARSDNDADCAIYVEPVYGRNNSNNSNGNPPPWFQNTLDGVGGIAYQNVNVNNVITNLGMGGQYVLADASPDYATGPITFTGNAAVTQSRYYPAPKYFSGTIKPTGTITALTYTVKGGSNGTDFPYTLATGTLTTFSAATTLAFSTVGNSPGPMPYISITTTNVTLGGTNFIMWIDASN